MTDRRPHVTSRAHCVTDLPQPTHVGLRRWCTAETSGADVGVYNSPPDFLSRSENRVSNGDSAIGAVCSSAVVPVADAPDSGREQMAVLATLLLVLLASWLPW
ncbi:hypothetical protein ACIA5G_52020 [Amycolatopsis sp. NPDC051758]|uniref:hypothetical protein n=1 Tax=Amycolatopsis sp. NPDC051758 TaxID=3363935 RepID=UPI0037B235B5